ncbi:hypothetical protein BJV77DRAFT_1159618 [Russula vinacea]|nr:hypothetical protein BJV77DRAFT_1159618 [Russula vinacea]
MYNDNASEVPIYLVPTNDGTGKRFVRRPHPPPTTAPLPDDFDAITETRDSTTVYDDAANSALDIDYDAITVAPLYAQQQQQPPIPIHAPIPSPAPLPVPVPTSPPPNPTSPRQRRAASPSQSFLGFSPDVRGSRRGGDSHHGKARSVAGGDRDHGRDRERTGQRRSRGPAKGRNDLVEKLVLEDGPERTISVWRESVAKNASEAGRGGRGAGAGASADDGAAPALLLLVVPVPLVVKVKGAVTWTVMSGVGGKVFNSAGHPPSLSAHDTAEITTSPADLTIGARRRRRWKRPKRNRIHHVVSLGRRLDQSCSVSQIESVLASCQPSLLHLLPILEELGVRRSEHMAALARMREQTRDREVKEEALKKGVTVVEWAILIDNCRVTIGILDLIREVERREFWLDVPS